MWRVLRSLWHVLLPACALAPQQRPWCQDSGAFEEGAKAELNAQAAASWDRVPSGNEARLEVLPDTHLVRLGTSEMGRNGPRLELLGLDHLRRSASKRHFPRTRVQEKLSIS